MRSLATFGHKIADAFKPSQKPISGREVTAQVEVDTAQQRYEMQEATCDVLNKCLSDTEREEVTKALNESKEALFFIKGGAQPKGNQGPTTFDSLSVNAKAYCHALQELERLRLDYDALRQDTANAALRACGLLDKGSVIPSEPTHTQASQIDHAALSHMGLRVDERGRLADALTAAQIKHAAQSAQPIAHFEPVRTAVTSPSPVLSQEGLNIAERIGKLEPVLPKDDFKTAFDLIAADLLTGRVQNADEKPFLCYQLVMRADDRRRSQPPGSNERDAVAAVNHKCFAKWTLHINQAGHNADPVQREWFTATKEIMQPTLAWGRTYRPGTHAP
jgi:hypothetical protein